MSRSKSKQKRNSLQFKQARKRKTERKKRLQTTASGIKTKKSK